MCSELVHEKDVLKKKLNEYGVQGHVRKSTYLISNTDISILQFIL